MDTKFKIGDIVYAKGYVGELVILELDESLTNLTKKLHWLTVSRAYLEGKHKTYNGDSYTEDELILTDNVPGLGHELIYLKFEDVWFNNEG